MFADVRVNLVLASLNPCYNGMTIELKEMGKREFWPSLNPCYNGMTIELDIRCLHLVSSGLNPCYNGMTIEHGRPTDQPALDPVLILVIME